MDRQTIFDKLFPTGVTVTDEVPHKTAPGVYLGGAHLDNTMISYLKQGDVQPLSKMSFVIGVQGRGTLNIPGDELMKLLACGNALVKRVAGLDEPIIDGEFTAVPADIDVSKGENLR